MVEEENIDWGGLDPTESSDGQHEKVIATLTSNLVPEEALWRAAILHGPQGVGKTALALQFAQQMVAEFDTIQLIPLTAESTVQGVLDTLSDFLLENEKNLRSKRVSNFEEAKDTEETLVDKVDPLIKLMCLRRLLTVFNNYQPDSELAPLLTLLLENVDKPSRFIITSPHDFNPLLGRDDLASTVGHIALNEIISEAETDIEPTEEEPPMAEEQSPPETPEEEEDTMQTEDVAPEESAAETVDEAAAESTDEQPPAAEETPTSEEAEAAPPEAEADADTEEDTPAEPEEPLDQDGLSYMLSGSYQQAKLAYEQALQACQESDDKTGAATQTEGLGTVYMALGNYNQAQSFYENAFSLWQELDSKPEMIEQLRYLTLLSQLQGNKKQVQHYQQQIDEILHPPEETE